MRFSCFSLLPTENNKHASPEAKQWVKWQCEDKAVTSEWLPVATALFSSEPAAHRSVTVTFQLLFICSPSKLKLHLFTWMFVTDELVNTIDNLVEEPDIYVSDQKQRLRNSSIFYSSGICFCVIIIAHFSEISVYSAQQGRQTRDFFFLLTFFSQWD